MLKLTMRLKCFCDDPIKHLGIKSVWISSQNKGCNRFSFRFIREQVINFSGIRALNLLFNSLRNQQEQCLVKGKYQRSFYLFK